MINLNKGISTLLAITIIIVLVVLVGGGILTYQYWRMPKEEVKDETADWQTYRNEEYGFSFKYPQEWGDVIIEQGKNIADLKGEYFEIVFTNQTQIDPNRYDNIPRIISFSPDWQVYEAPAPFYSRWEENQSTEDFCKEFIKPTLVNDGCKNLNTRSDIFVVNYVYYIEMGMFGAGDQIDFARKAFIELGDEKFKGLTLDLFFSKLTDSAYPQKTADEIKSIAISNFNQTISSQENKIETFNKILSSFSVTK